MNKNATFNPIKTLIIKLIRFYQRFISPLSAPRCRFYPTCSQYALEAVQVHGAAKGSWLGFKRICRCHPWGGSGIDFVPPKTRKQIINSISWQHLIYEYMPPCRATSKMHTVLDKFLICRIANFNFLV